MPTNIGDPLILTASATLAPGAEVSPNLASLSNPYGLPMELLEVRFSVVANTYDGTQFRNITGLGIGIKADLGKITVIDTDVPMSCFGSYRDTSDPNTASQLEVSPVGFTVNFQGVNTYTWRLKYPLYIPGGTTLNIGFHHLSQEPVNAKIWVTYHCRVRAKGYKPAKLMVPWVCSYSSKPFNVIASEPADSDESSELDLINPFGVPLEVTRLVGAYTSIVLGSGTTINTASEIINPAQPRQYTYVTMRTSQGDDVVFTPTYFEALWPGAWRAWDLPDGTLFEPNKWLKVKLTRPSIDYDPSTLNNQGVSLFAVSLVGYREVGGAEFTAAANQGGA